MKKSLVIKLAALAALVSVAGPVLANPCPPGNPPTNCGPPAGTVIFDLAAQPGSPLPQSYTEYTATFVATSSAVNLSFAFREDPAWFSLDDVALTQGGGSNLLLNGDFSAGTLDGDPTDWTSLNSFGAAAPGYLMADCGVTAGTNCWYDGSVQAYDGLTQAVTGLTVGATYTLSFELEDNNATQGVCSSVGPLTHSQQLSTNGDISDECGNGADVLAYAGAVPVEAVPEPGTLALLGVGLAGLGLLRRRRMV